MVRGMEQRISIVTLGVSDLARARAFYEALGWRGQEVEETVFFQAGPLVLVLWARAKLAADSGVPDDGRGFDGVTLAQNVRSADEVDAVVAAAAEAGATVTRQARPDVLRRLRRRLPRPGRPRVGDRAQPGLHDHGRGGGRPADLLTSRVAGTADQDESPVQPTAPG